MAHQERRAQLQRFTAALTAPSAVAANARRPRPVPPLEAVRQRHLLTRKQMLGAFEPEACVAWRTFLVPTELFYATGTLPFTPEMACAGLSPNQDVINRSVERAEVLGHDPKQCSFLKTMVGAAHEGLLPTPDLIVGSLSFCAGISPILQDIADHLDRPFFFLNLPQHTRSPEAVDYLAGQLESLTRELCQHSGASLQEVERDRLPLAIERSNQAGACWREISGLRQHAPSPMSMREAIDFATVLAQTWGSQEIVDIYGLLRDELRERIAGGVAAVPNETLRLVWLHLRPYYSKEVLGWLEDYGAAVVFEEVNFPTRSGMDPSDPYTSLAREILTNSGRYRSFTPEWEDDLRDGYLSKDFQLDGVVHFYHENCGWADAVYPPMQRYIRQQLELPLLSVTGDCLVKSREQLLFTRVHAFLEGLAARKRGRTAGTTRSDSDDVTHRPAQAREGWFAGIDVGSATIKVAIVDQDGVLRGHCIRPTGPEGQERVELALDEALRQSGDLPRERISRFVATGVGRGAVPFPHVQKTEVTCHARGVQDRVPGARTVIDIGGQDTKAILVRERLNLLNDSCAAGTGKFLEAISRALDLTPSELARVDALATEPIRINKICTVFAESEVVDRVAAGAPIPGIVRGCHEMVAGKATTLVRRLSREILHPVVFSGGVARNEGVVRAVERGIGAEVLIPEHPQIMGAFGAALIARDGLGAERE